MLGWDSARFLTQGNQPGSPGFTAAFEALVARRSTREPLAYITGTKEFWGLAFEVSPDVLIPRPETELLVEATLEMFPSRDMPLAIADVCTGSGCVAIALACERPYAHILALDVSEAALAVARRNAARHSVSSRAHCLHSDLLNAVPGAFDLIVSNPPYVPSTHRRELSPEVRDFEPSLALFAGGDGLAIIDRLVSESVDRLKPGGVLIFEFGAGQDQAVAELVSRTVELTMLTMKPDLQGIPRAAVARRTGHAPGERETR